MGKKKNSELKNGLPRFGENSVIEKYAQTVVGMDSCLDLIKSILDREGIGKNPFTMEKALDLDRYERETSGARQDSTVDIVVGCRNNCFLLCEAKFRAKKVDHFVGDLPKKVNHSKDILHSSDSIVSVFPMTVVLLSSRSFYQNERRFYNLLGNSREYKVLTAERFFNEVFV